MYREKAKHLYNNWRALDCDTNRALLSRLRGAAAVCGS
jgi:hypothetical protein